MSYSMTMSHDESGISLVELIVVVAIVGVLASIAVPTYREFVARARKTEGKISLGEVYTVEQSFFSEQGAYSNNLGKIGIADAFFWMQLPPNGTSSPLNYYVVGFPGRTGAWCSGSGFYVPDSSTSVGKQIEQSMPGFYSTSAPLSLYGNFWRVTPFCASNLWIQNLLGITYPDPIDVYSSLGGQYDRFNAAASGTLNLTPFPSCGVRVNFIIIDQDRNMTELADIFLANGNPFCVP